jgi:putative transposase
MVRTCLTDTQWERMAPLVPGKPGDPGATGRDNRRFVEAVLWIARTGAPWRDLPVELGNWNSAWRRFARWSAGGAWERLFAAAAAEPDFEYVIVDATIVRAHQHAAGGKGGLKLRPSAARAAVPRPSCTSRWTPWATPCASGSPPGSGTR